MSDNKREGFWADLSELERQQIKGLLKMLGVIVVFTIIASLTVGTLITIFG